MKKVSSLCLLLLISACGGGSNSDSPAPSTTPSVASVSGVTPDKLMYNKEAKFTVTGTALDKGINMSSPQCDKITTVAGGTATQQIFTCTPNSVGKLTISLNMTNVPTPYTADFTIPAPRITMKTNQGDIEIELYPTNAPKSVNNILAYVSSGFYSNTIFHRVMKGFMIQCCGFDTSLHQKTTNAPIKLESGNGLKNSRGMVAMARTSVPDSATSQFYINTVDNIENTQNNLDGTSAGVNGYAVFGKVVNGMTTVDAIEALSTTTINGMANVPSTLAIVTEVTQTQ